MLYIQYDFFANFQHGIDKWDVLSLLNGSRGLGFCGEKVLSPIINSYEKAATVTISSGCARSKHEEISIAFNKAISGCKFTASKMYSLLVLVTVNRNDFNPIQAQDIVADSSNNLKYVILAPTFDPQINNGEVQVTILLVEYLAE